MVRGTAGSVHFCTMLNGRVHHTVGRCSILSLATPSLPGTSTDAKMCECSDGYCTCCTSSTCTRIWNVDYGVQVLASTLLVVVRCTVQYLV